MTPLDWIVSSDTGVSSKTIWSVMMGATIESWHGVDIPHDPADFGRCYRLLNAFPEWRGRLQEVADKYPKWGPLVDIWDELESLYEEEMGSGNAPKLYALMKSVYDDCMAADGWVKDGPSSWRKA